MKSKIYIFDFEVFRYDWLVVFSTLDGKEVKVIHNDNAELKRFMLQKSCIFGGYNVKHYDNWIAQAIIAGCSPEEVKACNDWIINQEKNGWEFPLIKGMRRDFISFDLMDDLSVPISLKAIEANCCDNIVESEVDFNIDHPLTKEELKETIFYCTNDVKATVKLYELRKSYIQGKLDVGALKGWDETICLPLTNPKLTAKFLGAKPQKHDDEFTYVFPKELRLEKYTTPLEFYEEVSYDKKLELEVAGVVQKYGWGGIHSAREHYQDKSTKDYKIVDIDVGSYYPSLICQYSYQSRNIPSADGYAQIYKTRLEAKHSGNDTVSSTLKLVLNSFFGASKDKYNDLFDARMANAICITGQLFLTDLVEKLESVEGMKLIQTNTDGIMIGYPAKAEKQIVEIVHEWEQRTRMNMEYTDIHRICCQKDVNNYVMLVGATYLFDKDGNKIITKPDKNKITVKGGWASLYNGGTWQNNSMVIVHKALVDYFVYGKAPEDTINEATNIFDFQIITKTTYKYSSTVHEVDGEDVAIQRCNRVYATADIKYGMVYKIKNGSKTKFADIPEHCVIDNDNHLKLEDVDKQFYINLAWKRIKDYLGVKDAPKPKTKKKETKKMATTKTEPKPNLMQKLNKARIEFLKKGIKKTGKNRHIGYDYYKLDDIVPAVLQIFDELGLYHETQFIDDVAYMGVYDVENPSESRMFQFPMLHITANKGMNECQATQAEITYYTRSLYLIMLQIVEADVDVFDETQTEEDAPTVTEKPKAPIKDEVKPPATKEDRAEAVKEMTSKMSLVQKNSIVAGLKKLRASGENHESFINEVTSKLKAFKDGTLSMSTSEAEDIMLEIGKKLEAKNA